MSNPSPNYNYMLAYYRRNNFGQPCVWAAYPWDDFHIEVYHGIVGKTITREIIRTDRKPKDEVQSRVNAKRKVGYKLLCEIKDSNSLPVEEQLLSFLDTYLPKNRTTADNVLLPMLAKTYTPKVFDKCSTFIGQYKINGLRCFIQAYVDDDIFKTKHLKFISREGTVWNSLTNLEECLLYIFGDYVINKMIDDNLILDGELYLPNHSVNEINHFVKDRSCIENAQLQYWCYDIAVEEYTQAARSDLLRALFNNRYTEFFTKSTHLSNTNRFVVLPAYNVGNSVEALAKRDTFIDYGFEGLILRNPKAEYQFGKRNQSMIKFKRADDGMFEIIDIYPEGIKRSNIPLLLLRNDINDATFEVHIGGKQQYQTQILNNKGFFIGKTVYLRYGERSGVNKVPFHVRDVKILI